jgi:hypothetical protein
MENHESKDPSPDPNQRPGAGAGDSSNSNAMDVPWYVRRGALSGDKRLERLGFDTENLSAVEITSELRKRMAEIKANKKRSQK